MALNLPDVQVSDLVVHGQDLVIATHGRSFWVLGDISPLRQYTTAEPAASNASTAAAAAIVRLRRDHPWVGGMGPTMSVS